ncbi:DNA cytosine methyltransferase [Saccharothrix violaceirubra]|uniref:DNA (cytosine-5-)-methyltransferase n=1 Tax=Saccharothrix violaceirubra TaxID=413306 RepID=A0A7W7T1R7_9PSEU|nr:DNA cytosine methyltransferase [Saccharothrix violaceirubra]MBB4963750.1 DNA (cytosine-5)-methyltransferase 1 [Saccharothrix violaceirubra]
MITVTDLFCGAGGSGLGATAVPGVQLVMAANHSPRAIETHAANFPDCAHDCADISQVEPRRYRRTNILWASPECTSHSVAKGRKRRQVGPGLFDEPLPDHVAERSRATMWDVPRFAEVHRYDAVIVENVVDAAHWAPFQAWLMAMDSYGYDHHVVYLNSMHAPAIAAPRAPQSRDRMYVVLWRRGNRRPDLEIRPRGWCTGCAAEVECRQAWKRRGATWPLERWGRYRAQYTYACTTPGCGRPVEPYVLPAASAIDWSMLGERIGDRDKPLSDKTIARIRAGLARYAGAQLVPSGGTWNESAQPVTGPFRSRTTRENEGLLVPVEGRVGNAALPAAAPMRTQTTRHETALVVPYYGTAEAAQPTDRPLGTLTTVDRYGLAFIAELRGGGSTARDVREPLSTVTASGTHHMLVRHNTARGDEGYLSTPVDEPMRTLTTAGHQSLVGWSERPPAVEDCTFRMLAVPEIQRAMAFGDDYVVTGNKREQVKQLGNGVTPPAAEFLIRAVVDSLTP